VTARTGQDRNKQTAQSKEGRRFTSEEEARGPCKSRITVGKNCYFWGSQQRMEVCQSVLGAQHLPLKITFPQSAVHKA